MLTVISPAKTLDFDSPPVTRKRSNPDFLSNSGELIEILRERSAADIAKLMSISPGLAQLNATRYQDWAPPFTAQNAKQAVLAFRGDVYLGLAAETMKPRDFDFAQKHLRILSGLYGLLKPLDMIQPYRLEMGTRLANARGKDLYCFWGDRLTTAISSELESHRNKTLVNLASNEYFKSVRPDLLERSLITPIFKDYNRGAYRVLGFYAKRARGQMVAFVIRNRIDRPEGLKDFNEDGYRFNVDYSSQAEWVFTRKAS